jgi:hypothetical protein
MKTMDDGRLAGLKIRCPRFGDLTEEDVGRCLFDIRDILAENSIKDLLVETAEDAEDVKQVGDT